MATTWTFRRKAACATGACVLLLLAIWVGESAPPSTRAARAFIRCPETKELQQLIRSADSIEIRAVNQPRFADSDVRFSIADKSHIEELSAAAALKTRMHPPEHPNVKYGMKSIYCLTLIADETPFASLTIRGFTGFAVELQASFGRTRQFDGGLEGSGVRDEIFRLHSVIESQKRAP